MWSVPNRRAWRSAAARAPSRSPTRRRRAISPSRPPESARIPSVCWASRAWVNRGTRLVPSRFARETRRHRLRYPVASRASSTRCGPRCRSPMPRRSSFTTSRWPGSRVRSGRGRAGSPSIARLSGGAAGPRLRGRRRAGSTMPPGSGAAASWSSISTPMIGRMPTASAAVAKRTTPYSPSWSVTASPDRPRSAARSTMSSTGEAPCRNEKLVWLWSSA